MTTAAIVASLSVGAMLGCLGPCLARRLPPRQATWLISVGATVAALTAAAVLVLVGAALLGQLSDLLGLGHWSSSILRERAPTDPGVAVLALIGAVASGVSLVLVAIRRALYTWGAYRTCEAIDGDPRLVVVDDPAAGAVAIPGRPGTIAVSRTLLAALSPFERRVVLAHERAHLAAGHHWHRTVVAIAAAANPLLRPLIGAVSLATERWADERAAAEVGDRRGAARALARVALLTGGTGSTSPELAIGGRPVVARVSALLDDAPPPRPLLTATTIAILFLALAAVVVVEKDVEHLFELAGHVYQAASGRAGR
ncbi:MAG: M56 family metallopeptidase [Actinobacteria bacterium]|nr:M56 family metallopeptidase [Actinomycetota bacterium]